MSDPDYWNRNQNVYTEPKDYDLHCPAVGTEGLNFWREQCLIKQKDPLIRSCYGGCQGLKAKKISETCKKNGSQSQEKFGTRQKVVALIKAGVDSGTIKATLEVSTQQLANYVSAARRKGELER